MKSKTEASINLKKMIVSGAISSRAIFVAMNDAPQITTADIGFQ